MVHSPFVFLMVLFFPLICDVCPALHEISLLIFVLLQTYHGYLCVNWSDVSFTSALLDILCFHFCALPVVFASLGTTLSETWSHQQESCVFILFSVIVVSWWNYETYTTFSSQSLIKEQKRALCIHQIWPELAMLCTQTFNFNKGYSSFDCVQQDLQFL